jgi:hypothetical protein
VFIPQEKELFFFGRHFDKGLEWYESCFKDWHGQTAVGEGTVSYLSNAKAPARISEALGNQVKLIVSLRHPVDRAYSAYWMLLSRGYIPEDTDFHAFLSQNSYGARRLGCYFTHLSRYLRYFPWENFLILIYEELKEDGQRAVSDCFEFLGVDSQFVPGALSTRANKGIDVSIFHHRVWNLRRSIESLPKGIERPLASVGRHVFELLPKRRSREPLVQDLRQELLSEFMPDIRQLESLLDRDLSIWYAP